MLSRCVASSSDRLLNPQTPLAPGKWVFLSFLAGISISSSTTTPLMSSDKTLQGCKLLFFLVRRNFQLKQNFGQTRQNYIVGHYLKWIFSSVWLSDSHLQEGACYKVMLSSITQDSTAVKLLIVNDDLKTGHNVRPGARGHVNVWCAAGRIMGKL